jgi:hypothetical protein
MKKKIKKVNKKESVGFTIFTFGQRDNTFRIFGSREAAQKVLIDRIQGMKVKKVIN